MATWLANGFAACLLLFASFGEAAATDAVRVAEGVYVFVGAAGEISPENLGRIGNSGFIVSDTEVTLIDSGMSHAHGLELLAAVRRVTDKPLGRLILTHAVQEFIYGTSAYVDAGARPLCHAGSATLMRSRCEHCLQNLRTALGEPAMAGTRLVVPDDLVDGSTDLRSGDRIIELIHPGWASTPGDLMVLDRRSGVLFAGGVVTNGRIPELRDGQLDTWLETLQSLGQRPLNRVIPGYGPPMPPERVADTLDYLRALDAAVQQLYAASASLMETIEGADAPAFRGWTGYDSIHRRNAQLRYLQLETKELDSSR